MARLNINLGSEGYLVICVCRELSVLSMIDLNRTRKYRYPSCRCLLGMLEKDL